MTRIRTLMDEPASPEGHCVSCESIHETKVSPAMGIVAKLAISEIQILPRSGGTVKLSAVSRGDKNATWAAATPSGLMTVHATEENLAWFLRLRQDVLDYNATTFADIDPAWRASQAGSHACEVLVYIGEGIRSTPPDGSIPLKMNVSTIDRRRDGLAAGKATLAAVNGPYSTMELQINNPPAFEFLEAHFENHSDPLDVTITRCSDGYPGDGHTFVKSVYPAGTYGHDNCGECGGTREQHG